MLEKAISIQTRMTLASWKFSLSNQPKAEEAEQGDSPISVTKRYPNSSLVTSAVQGIAFRHISPTFQLKAS